MKSFVLLAAAFLPVALASTIPVANNPLAAIIAADTVIIDDAIAELCNHDNVLRCLLGDPLIANPFCIDYISIPMKTTTVSTVTPAV